MPIIPFLILTAKVAGGVGAVLSGDAISKNRQAKNINVGASARYDFAKESTEYAQAKANTSIENLGELKLRILDTTVKNYIEIFEKIHNLELSNIDLLTNDIYFDNEIIIKMRELNANAHSVLSGIAAGVGAGAAAAFGAYGATMTFASASTGTAISALHGIAAKNATLAFLGGGTLAAGGTGIAGGLTALNTLSAGPFIAVLGITMEVSAIKNLDKVISNASEIEKAIEGLNVIEVLCNSITMRTEMFVSLLKKLDETLIILTEDLSVIIENSGDNYLKFDEEQQNTVAMSLSALSALKTVLDTAILDDNGNVTEESQTTYTAINNVCDTQFIKAPPKDTSNVNFIIVDPVTTETIAHIRTAQKKLSSVSYMLKEDLAKSKLLTLSSIFKIEEHATVDDIIAFYDPSLTNCITGNYSGMLFTKDTLFYKEKPTSPSMPIHYRNIKYIEQKFSSTIIYTKINQSVKLKGISFSTDDFVTFLRELAKINSLTLDNKAEKKRI